MYKKQVCRVKIFKNLKVMRMKPTKLKRMKVTLKLRKKLFHLELEWFRLLFGFPLPFNSQTRTMLL